jgi:hypothetical protein
MHRLEEASARHARRGVYRARCRLLTDGKGDERVYVTIGYQLVGLNAKDGVPLKVSASMA